MYPVINSNDCRTHSCDVGIFGVFISEVLELHLMKSSGLQCLHDVVGFVSKRFAQLDHTFAILAGAPLADLQRELPREYLGEYRTPGSPAALNEIPLCLFMNDLIQPSSRAE